MRLCLVQGRGYPLPSPGPALSGIPGWQQGRVTQQGHYTAPTAGSRSVGCHWPGQPNIDRWRRAAAAAGSGPSVRAPRAAQTAGRGRGRLTGAGRRQAVTGHRARASILVVRVPTQGRHVSGRKA